MTTFKSMRDLPEGARFRWVDGREFVVTTPGAEDRDGWVHVLDDSGEGGFFTRGQVEREVEVISE